MLMAKVLVAWTTPAVAKSVPEKVPRPRVVVVAFVATRFVEKKFVEVACEVVAYRPEKSWKVEEPVTTRLVVVALVAVRLMRVVRPVLVMEKRVVVEVSLVEEEMLKTRALIGEDEARKSEKLAMAEVVPRPRLPRVLMEA